MNKPALYTEINAPQRRDVCEFYDEFTDEINEMSGRCLDIGSGPGDSAVDLLLPKLNAKTSLVCSDISEEMVNFAKEKYKDNRRLSFLKLNIQTPELPADLIEQFDHVTSSFCLNWCYDLRQVFENIFNLLRPEGTALIIFLAHAPVFNVYLILADMPQYQPYMKDAYRYVPPFQHSESPLKSLKALIEEVDFEVRHCSRREKTVTFDTPDMLGKFMLGIDPFIKRIPTDLKEEYMKDIVKESVKQNFIVNKNNENEDEYSVLLPYSSFVVNLRKPSAN